MEAGSCGSWVLGISIRIRLLKWKRCRKEKNEDFSPRVQPAGMSWSTICKETSNKIKKNQKLWNFDLCTHLCIASQPFLMDPSPFKPPGPGAVSKGTARREFGGGNRNTKLYGLWTLSLSSQKHFARWPTVQSLLLVPHQANGGKSVIFLWWTHKLCAECAVIFCSRQIC